jgi:hypothetical protein
MWGRGPAQRIQIKKNKKKLYLNGRQSHANCTHVAASCMQISVNFFMLHATGGHTGTICKRLAATRVQIICNRLLVACKFCMRYSDFANY